jgi:sensor domain CHASE-containing protein
MAKIVKVVAHHENPARAAELFVEDEVVAVGWIRKESIARKTKDEIKQMLVEEGCDNPDWGVSQLILFRDEIEISDVVIAYRTKNIVALVG